MLRPRSLAARLFVAIAVVAGIALALGAWLFERAGGLERNEQVIVRMAPTGPGGALEREETREVTTTPTDPPVVRSDRRLLGVLAIVVIGAALATALVARRVLGPITHLDAAARALAEGSLDARVPEQGADELASLSRTFNLMAARLETQERIKRDLTNDVAHELRTPLTNLRCHLEAIADGVVPVDGATFAALGDDVRRLERLVDDLNVIALAETRQLRLTPEATAVDAVIAAVVRDATPRALRGGVTLVATVPPDLPAVWVDPMRLTQMVANLVDNALAHTPAGGSITCHAEARADRVWIHVRDTGSGIAPEHLPHVFDRFYRADPSRSRLTGGSGLGLAIVRQLARASGGDVTVTSDRAQGTTFTLQLGSDPGLTPV